MRSTSFAEPPSVALPSSLTVAGRVEPGATSQPSAVPSSPMRPDPVAPARGILLGLAAGALAWVLLILFWVGAL